MILCLPGEVAFDFVLGSHTLIFCTSPIYQVPFLLQKGQRLDTGTNNSAESNRAATAFTALVRYFYGVTEQLAELMQRSGDRE